MATAKIDKEPKLLKVTKKEIVYEHVPILFGLLGWCRKSKVNQIGESVEIHLRHSLSEYDCIVINGVQIEIPKEALTR